MLMMGKALHKKMEMYAVNAYVMYWGSDYIPSDVDSEEMCCTGVDLAMFGSSICWSMKSRQWISISRLQTSSRLTSSSVSETVVDSDVTMPERFIMVVCFMFMTS